MRTILVPLDGSARAELGLRTAGRVAIETGAELVLLRAGLAFGAGHGNERRYARGEVHDAETYLAQLQQRLLSQGLASRILVLPGDALQAILFAAETEQADLISMATHGHGGLLDRLLGSVTAAVLRATERPVLVTRIDSPTSEEAAPMRTILVGLDGTRFAERGLSFLAESGLGHKARVLLTQAVEQGPPTPAAGLVSDKTLGQLAEESQHITERHMEEAEGYIQATAVELLPGWNSRAIVVAGEPGSVLVDVASGEHADMVVLMTHGRRGMDRLLNSGVTRTVLRHCTAPVLILQGSEVAAKVAVLTP
jgi:nucleotide-binding universal stress UspA family protein